MKHSDNYGGDTDFTPGERKAWVRGYLWALDHIESSAVKVDLANLRDVQTSTVRVTVTDVPKVVMPHPRTSTEMRSHMLRDVG